MDAMAYTLRLAALREHAREEFRAANTCWVANDMWGADAHLAEARAAYQRILEIEDETRRSG